MTEQRQALCPSCDEATLCGNPFHQPLVPQEGIREALEKHEPVAMEYAGSAWIECDCGWKGDSRNKGQTWLEHFNEVT